MTAKSTRQRNAGIEQKMNRFVQNCRRAGLKITPQRLAVYRHLAESKEHPSADKLWRRLKRAFPGISLDTVNRTLITLAEIGVTSVVEGSGDVRRYDADMDNHQHFKCIKCKRIFDFHYRPFDDIKLPASILARFKVLRKTVYLEGICASCRRKTN